MRIGSVKRLGWLIRKNTYLMVLKKGGNKWGHIMQLSFRNNILKELKEIWFILQKQKNKRRCQKFQKYTYGRI
jgi:hypothetical protein